MSDEVTEYHVVFDIHWRVKWKTKTLGYPASDKRVALSAAKEMAKKTRPSKVIIHSRKGIVEKELSYDKP
jgi:hypothetical protein